MDTTGQSYYGSTSLHLLSADGSSEDFAIPLPKDGPVYDVQWSPDPLKVRWNLSLNHRISAAPLTHLSPSLNTQPFFIVLSGMMPAQACLFNAKCEQVRISEGMFT